jgi:predicted N-acetyltransferase YhbS
MPAGFQVLAPDRKIHGPEMLELVLKSFGNYFERRDSARRWMLEGGFYSFPATRIGIMDGKVVTHWGVFDYQMRVGAARLRTGGIGSVITHPDYRKRGLMDKTAWDCLEGLRRDGFDFSMLYGIQNFYEKFGYTRALSESDYTAALADLPATAKSPRFAEFPFERREDLERLFNRHHAQITGSAVRPTYLTWNLRGKQLLGLSWNDRRGRLAGYLAVEDKGSRVDVLEAVGDGDSACAAAAFAARKFACDEIKFVCLAHESPLARRLRAGNMVERTVYFRNGMALARIIHLPRTLAKMEPEFSRRLGMAGLRGYRAKLAIGDRRDWATLLIDRGRVRAVEGREKTPHVLRGGDELSQLILGTDDADGVIRAGAMRATADAPFLARTLFPRQWPMLAVSDHY